MLPERQGLHTVRAEGGPGGDGGVFGGVDADVREGRIAGGGVHHRVHLVMSEPHVRLRLGGGGAESP